MRRHRRYRLAAVLLAALALLGLLSCSDGGPFGPLYYVGNRTTEVYHKPSCRLLPEPADRITFDSCEEANDAGYMRCGSCNPCH